jgi:hypothetical protein
MGRDALAVGFVTDVVADAAGSLRLETRRQDFRAEAGADSSSCLARRR